MSRVVWAFIVPIGVVAFVAAGIVGIGTLLLTARATTGSVFAPVATALILTLIVSGIATFLATRPVSSGPERR